MKKLIALVSLFLTIVMILPAAASVPDGSFCDLDGYEWARDSIEKLRADGLFMGTGDGYFSPDGYLKAAETAATLWRLAGCPEAEKTWENYTVWNVDPYGPLYPSSDEWYYGCAVWAAENGIIELENGEVPVMRADTRAFPKQDYNLSFDVGVGEHFPSYRGVKRGDIVISMFFFTEYLDRDTSSSADISGYTDYEEITDENWYNCNPVNNVAYIRTDSREFCETHIRDYLSWAVGVGILKGYPDGSLRPYEHVTRAEYAVMLDRFVEFLGRTDEEPTQGSETVAGKVLEPLGLRYTVFAWIDKMPQLVTDGNYGEPGGRKVIRVDVVRTEKTGEPIPDIGVRLRVGPVKTELVRDAENPADRCSFWVTEDALGLIRMSESSQLNGILTFSSGGVEEKVSFTADVDVVW